MRGPRWVVTLPPGLSTSDAVSFTRRAKVLGAQLLELRTDLHPASTEVEQLAAHLPLLVAMRGVPLSPAWVRAAELVDTELGLPGASPDAASTLISAHFPAPQDPARALAAWDSLPPDAALKHVEPLGSPERLPALLALQEALIARFGEGRTTVLVTGALAGPARAILSARNSLEYVAASPAWSSAPGQRLLQDAVRAARAPHSRPRLGILGTAIAHSRSPRLHRAPFDRIDLPADAPVEALVDALLPFYRGFAVTSPFKKRLAAHVGSGAEAINTLWREGGRWRAANTDVDGAREALRLLGEGPVQVLGDGGATTALKEVAGDRVRVLRRAGLVGQRLRGLALWTWPAELPPPEDFGFADQTRVGVIAYGEPGRRVAATIRSLGGTPVKLGMPWLLAQARAQRAHWDQAL